MIKNPPFTIFIDMVDQLYSVAQVAAFFGVSPRTIYSWIDAGYLNAVKLPSGTIRIRRSDLVKFIQENLTISEDIPQRLRCVNKSPIKNLDPVKTVIALIKEDLKILQDYEDCNILRAKIAQIVDTLETA